MKDKDEKNIFISELLNRKIIELHWNNSTLLEKKDKNEKKRKND